MQHGMQRLREFDAWVSLKDRAEVSRRRKVKQRAVVVARSPALRRVAEYVTRVVKQV